MERRQRQHRTELDVHERSVVCVPWETRRKSCKINSYIARMRNITGYLTGLAFIVAFTCMNSVHSQ